MAKALEKLHGAGADFGIIATNTMHIVFDEVQRAVQMPLLSIVQATAEGIHEAGVKKVGLLGTVFTMTEPFFRDGLAKSGLKVVVPEPADQQRINDVIYQELCRGTILESSRLFFLDVINRLSAQGAEGIVLGCTEIPLLIEPQHCNLPLFNTSLLHAAKALEFAL